MNINLELYKVFYYVAKNESISRAANELSISQPAISKSIKSLEEQINTNLFTRKRDGVELTEAGETIFKKIKDAMDLIYSAENDLEGLTNMESGIINIGASKTILHEFLMPYIKDFHKKYPKINIRIFTDKTSDLIRKSKMGLIDVIFTNLPFALPTEFEEFKLMDLHDCFAVNKNYDYLLNENMLYRCDKEFSNSTLKMVKAFRENYTSEMLLRMEDLKDFYLSEIYMRISEICNDNRLFITKEKWN